MAETKRTGGGHGRNHGYQRPKDMKGTFKKLMGYVGKYKGLLVLVAICLLISSAAGVATSYLLKPLLNDYIIPGDFPGLFKMLLVMGGMYLLSSLCSFAYARIMVHVAQHTVAALRQDLFNRLQQLSVSYYDRHQSGDLMSRFTNDIDTVSEMLNSSFASIISNVLTFVGTVVMMIVLNPWLTLITFLFLGLMGLVVKVIGGRSRANFQRQQAALGALNGYIEEMIEGQKVIKVFNHEGQAVERFTALNGDYRDAATAAQAYAGMMMPAMGNLSKINYAVTCCVGGLLAIGGVFDIGSLGAYLLYVKQVSQPVGQISQQINTLLAAAAGAERIFAVMDEQPETDEGKTVIVRVEKNGDTLTETKRRTGHWAWKKPDGTLVELRGDVRFDHVTFSYDGEKTVLNDVSLFAEPGQKIAQTVHLPHSGKGAVRRRSGQIVDGSVYRHYHLLPQAHDGHAHGHVAQGEQDTAVSPSPAVQAVAAHGQHHGGAAVANVGGVHMVMRQKRLAAVAEIQQLLLELLSHGVPPMYRSGTRMPAPTPFRGPAPHRRKPPWACCAGAAAGPAGTSPAPARRRRWVRPGTYPAHRRSRRPPEWPR